MDRAARILADVFGYNSFRPLQHEIISNILKKKDSLVVMPTGGGKSLCYQIPSQLFEGLTIVISPLISLMKDQVTQLRISGINTAVLNSSISKPDYYKNYKMVEKGEAKMLYLAPESLGREEIIQLLKKIRVDCIAVDEAHCISEWGHDFRKEYRQLGNMREKFSSAVCIALTATATPKVQDDIISNLKMKECKKFIGSFNRENLFLEVIKKIDPVQQTISFLQNRKGQSGIIYCFSRAQVDDLSSILSAYGFSNKSYHAGLTDEVRNKNQELFIKEEVDIIVATIAFGMGINKSNVRFIIHFDLPKNLESYYQEIGRSGRDGLRADCLLLFNYSDIRKIKYFIDEKENEAERKSAEMHLQEMVKYAQTYQCRRISLINYFGEKFNIDNCGMCDNCLESAENEIDLTIPAQKFLSAVKRTGETFGAGYIADLLTAEPNEKIIRNNHNKLTVYNIGQEYDKKTWVQIGKLLETKGLLNRNPEFKNLIITEKGILVLKKQLNVSGTLIQKEMPLNLRKREGNNLFELLKKKRKKIAESMNVAPFVIFSDKTLLEMSLSIPLNLTELKFISGVGQTKLYRFGDEFLNVIKDYCKDNIEATEVRARNRAAKFLKTTSLKQSRFVNVGQAFNSGKSIEQIAEMYNIKQERVIYHLLRYFLSGENLNTEPLSKYISIPENKRREVFYAFKELGTEKLSPVFTRFDGTISYNDIRLLQIIYLQEKKNNSGDQGNDNEKKQNR